MITRFLYYTGLLLALYGFTSCAQGRQIFTDAEYYTNSDTTCEKTNEGIYAFFDSTQFIPEYTVLGEMELVSNTTYSGEKATLKRKKSLFNMALMVAWDNCADAIVDVRVIDSRLYAKTVVFNEPINHEAYQTNYHTGFVAYLDDEMFRNEQEQERAREINKSFTSIVFGLLGIALIYALDGGE